MASADQPLRANDRESFRSGARMWLNRSVPDRWRMNRGALDEEEESTLRLEWEKILFRGGYAALSLPIEFGGQGLGLAEEVIFGELAAQAQAPDGMGRIGKILVAPTLVALGTEAQKRQYIPLIVSGELIFCQGFSEPTAGSDLANVSCSARKVNGGYVIRGRKTWTSYSRHADRCLLLARTDNEAPRHRNLTMFMLDMHQPGVDLSPIRQISDSRHFSETVFDDAFVSNDDVIGDVNHGWNVAMIVLGNERGTIEGVARYVEIRADMDLLIRCCAGPAESTDRLQDLDIRVELIRWQVAKAVSRLDNLESHIRSTSVLKVTWSELWQEITSLALTLSCTIHRAHWRHQYLESRSATIYSGTSEIQRNILAERILGMPR